MKFNAYFALKKWSGTVLIVFIFLFISACNPRIVSFNYPYQEMNFKIRPVRKLGKELKESSALEYYENKFWSLNDSGNDNVIYSFSNEKKSGIQKIKIHPSINIDWESLAQDDDYFYIADIGNNAGRRENLKIYIVSKENLLKGNGPVEDSISVRLDKNISGCTGKKISAFDCEAITVIGDSIYLFTKNWHDLISSLYVIPAKPGNYDLSKSSKLVTDVLVTGAGYCSESEDLWLIGYKNYHPVFIVFPGFISSGTGNISYLRFDYPRYIGLQVEGIACHGKGNVFFSCEKTLYPARLFKLIRKD